MNNREPRQITIQPIISYPREAEVGKTYLMTVDIQTVSGEEYWPYQSEELELYCTVDSEPVFTTNPFGEPTIILNRFGGSYGPVSFILTASSKEIEGNLRVNFVNGQGLLVHQVELPDIRVQKRTLVIRTQKPKPHVKPNVVEEFREYFRWLYESLENLSLAGIDPKAVSDQPNQPIAFDSVYVLPLVLGTDGSLATSAIDAMNKYTRLVILGEPGSGKTSLLNYIALCISGEALQNENANLSALTQQVSGAEEMKTVWDHGLLLPVKITLRDFAARGISDSSEQIKAEQLWSFLKVESGIADFVPEIQREFLENGGLLLLDGLDEIPQVDGQREQIRRFIEDVASTLPKVRIIVSSRPYAYQYSWQLPGFSTVTLAPFSREQITVFIERFYTQIAASRNLNPADAQARAESLIQALFTSAQLSEMAQRPLLLMLLVSLHAWRGGSLPKKREELYADTVDLMLDAWESQKVVRDGSGKVFVIQPGLTEWLKVGRDKIRSLLNQLAYETHVAQPDIPGPADIDESRLISGLLSLSNSPDLNPSQLVQYLRDRTGILLARGTGVYAFPNRTFQEYLAACHLINENYPDKMAELVRKDPKRWREVALLAGAKAARGAPYALWELVDALCYADLNSVEESSLVDVWGAQIAGQLIVEVADLSSLNTRYTTRLDRVRSWLTHILRSDWLPARERVFAGNNLAILGDPRPEVISVDLMQFCLIKGGAIQIGSKDTLPTSGAGTPSHEVLLSYDFWIGRFPVTNAQYYQFISDGGHENAAYWPEAIKEGIWVNGKINERSNPSVNEYPFNLPNHPVTGISWYEALAFTRWLTDRWHQQDKLSQDFTVTLPSEVEWEKAARGGLQLPTSSLVASDDFYSYQTAPLQLNTNPAAQRRYPWGNEFDPECANTAESGIATTSAVGCFSAGSSPYGCEEMSGNVYEWTRSQYKEYPYILEDGREDLSASRDVLRVIRGGHFNDNGADINCTMRQGVYPRHPLAKTGGFRVVIVPSTGQKSDFNIDDYGWTFVRNISPTDEQLAEAYRIVDELRDKLSNIRAVQEVYSEIVMYGSVARGTAIAPIADVDVLTIFKINPQRENPRVAYEIVQSILRQVYSRNLIEDTGKVRQFRSFGASTIVEMKNRMHLEVTPAVKSPDASDQILIPDWRVQKWVPSYHEQHAEFVDKFDKQTNGLFKPLVKMVKYWQTYSRKKKLFHSFVVENLVAANLDFENPGLLEAFQILLERFRKQYNTPQKLQRVPVLGVHGETKTTGITNTQSERYVEFMRLIDETLAHIDLTQKAQTLDQQVREWRKIFGNQFPERLPPKKRR